MSSEVILSLLCAVGIVSFITNLFTSSFLVSSFYNTTGLETNALVIFSLDLTFSYSVLQKKKDFGVYVYACALCLFVDRCVCLWTWMFVCIGMYYGVGRDNSVFFF